MGIGWEKMSRWTDLVASRRDTKASEEEFERLGGDAKHASQNYGNEARPFLRSGWEPFRVSGRHEASEEEFERRGGGAKHASEYFWRRGQTFL